MDTSSYGPKHSKKVGYCSRLKSAVCERLEKNDLSTDDRKDFEEIKNWIMFDFEL